MSKKNKNLFEIFIESIGLYFSNFDKFIKYMTFPVLGQVVGLLIVFLCTYFYSKNLPMFIEKYSIFDNFNTLVLMSVLVAIPGLLIFTKAFWEYLVAYGAINSMLDNMLKSGKVYDFNAHTELIKRRTASFIGLWMLFGTFSIIALCPLFWVPAAVLTVYFVLIFQVFTYESELSPVGCVKKSFMLVKGHFLSTFILMVMSGLLTWVFIPQIINNIFNMAGVNNFFAGLILPFMDALSLNDINFCLSQWKIPVIKSDDVAMFVVTTTVMQIIIQYTLPLRSLLFGMWYKKLNSFSELPSEKKKKKSTSKRSSEKLMEESHKKYSGSAKRLDRNILKRAMEKDDEEE